MEVNAPFVYRLVAKFKYINKSIYKNMLQNVRNAIVVEHSTIKIFHEDENLSIQERM